MVRVSEERAVGEGSVAVGGQQGQAGLVDLRSK